MDTALLSKSDIEQLITMKEVVEIVDKTYKELGEGKVINPPKLELELGDKTEWPPYGGRLHALPAYVGWVDSAGVKWSGPFRGNPQLGLPFIMATILISDPRTGQLRAVMDGTHITNMRTGAQSAVSLKYLHNKKPIRIGIYGAGAQSYTTIMAISEFFNIEELRVYDIKREASEKLAEGIKDRVTRDIIIVDSPEEAADGDAVICVTQAEDKFLKNSWVKPGTVVLPVGSYLECEDALILSADKIIVDHIVQTLHRGALKELSERGKITEKDIYATIGEVAAGKKKGRTSDNERILSVAIGIGAMDVAVGTVVYQRALEKELGGRFTFV